MERTYIIPKTILKEQSKKVSSHISVVVEICPLAI